jgi:predicted RNA binding protein YcfA (HicA-like mRNA interferase family)
MSKISKIEIQILSGRSDANIDFTDLRRLLNKLGFDERIKSSHHIFTKEEIEEIINIQPIGSKAKVYQVKQVRNLILKYKLGASDE